MKTTAILILMFAAGCGRGVSEGARTGYVVKLSNKGLFIKSWEGTMHLAGGGAGGGGSGSDTWDFTVRDHSIVQAVSYAQERGDRVTLKYVQWWAAPPSMDTQYEVTDVISLAGHPAPAVASR